jgi:glucose-1-phosphate adenylyltransferase
VAFGEGRIIDFTLSNCIRSQLTHPYILTQYRAHTLQQHVGRWWRRHGANAPCHAAPVCVSAANGLSYRGTADALLQNRSLFEESNLVVVLSADHVYEMDYRHLIATHLERRAAATIGSIVYPKSAASQLGVMEVDSTWRVRGFHEKPDAPVTLPGRPDRVLASMGIYAFDAAILLEALQCGSGAKSCFDIGRDLVPGLVKNASVAAFNFADKKTGDPLYWRDIGTLDSYYTTSMEWFGASGSIISKRAFVHETAQVHNSILLPGARVGRGARIRGAILDQDACVPAGARVGCESRSSSLYTVTPNGVIVVPAGAPRSSAPAAPSFLPLAVEA